MGSPTSASASRNVLISVRFSHYCEKARWALDRAGIDYREESHVPILSWWATFAAGGRRTVPVLVTPDGVLSDSTDILQWAHEQSAAAGLFPEKTRAEGTSSPPTSTSISEVSALEDEMDRRLGPGTRRIAYFHLLQRPEVLRPLLRSCGTGWEGRVALPVFPLLKGIIVRGLKVNAAGVERSLQSVMDVFSKVETRLADGRRYLTGDRFTAADLTFASLASPLLLPDRLSHFYPPRMDLPPAFLELVEQLRRTPAGRFGLRLYEERGESRSRELAAPPPPLQHAG